MIDIRRLAPLPGEPNILVHRRPSWPEDYVADTTMKCTGPSVRADGSRDAARNSPMDRSARARPPAGIGLLSSPSAISSHSHSRTGCPT